MSKKKETLFQTLRTEKAHLATEESGRSRYSMRLKFLLILSTVLICALFFTLHFDKKLNESSDYSIVQESIWPGKTVSAEFSFPIYKPYAQYNDEVKNAREEALLVFLYDETSQSESTNRLEKFHTALVEMSLESSEANTEIASENLLVPFMILKPQERLSTANRINRSLKSYLKDVYKRGLISISKSSIKKNEISVRTDVSSEIIFQTARLRDSIIFLEDAGNILKRSLNDNLIPLAMELASKLMIPNLNFSDELTKKAAELAGQSVNRTTGIVRKGEILIDKGDRVTEDKALILQSYQKSRFMRSETVYSFWNFLGSFGHSLIIFLIIIIYLFFMRKRIFYDNIQLSIICGIFVFVAFMAWLSLQFVTKFPLEYMIILPALSMLIAIVFDSRTAFYTTIAMALMVAGIRGNDYEASISLLFAGTLAAYSVRDIQSRTQMYQSFIIIFLGFLIPVVSFGLERSTELIATIYKAIIALMNSIVSPLATFGLLFLLERVSNVTTDLRIKEYDNLNHPLLRRLSETAPGTYQHTLSVAMLAETCARAINANTLLIRVGSYFHDIGKLGKPEYFAENQLDGESKHDLISSRKSAASIREHVSNGVALAKQYKLPQRIIDFIPMHHGTTLIKHFYAKALEESEGQPIDQENFRYPGPKPNNKEAVILMICDSAEALSRVFSNDKERFENALSGLIEERLLDGQLDEAEITFKDLKAIKETCVKNLAGMTHQRVPYKEIPKTNNSTDS